MVEVAAEAALQALPRCGRRVARAGNPKSSRTAAELWTGSMIGPNGRGCASCARTFATRFQRLGPNAGGGAERGTYGCRSGGVVAVRPIGGNVLGAAGFWFGVSGSWSRMRHQRAAAGWSSGRDPTAAADRTRSVASKPARARLLNLSCPPHLHIGDQLGRQGSVRPGRRPFGIEVDLVGELSDQV